MSKRSTEQEKVPEVTFLQKQIQKKKEKSSNVLTKTIEIVRKSREYKKANEMKLVDFEINSKDVAENLSCPLYRQYSPDDFMIARFDSRCPQKITQAILEKGVCVRYEGNPEILERYTFFAHSASQLRQRVCVLYNCAKLGPADKIITEFGDFSKLKTVAKRAARIGLLLSTAGETVWLDEKDVSRIDDVERDNYTFTDGCGYISLGLAEKVTEHLGIIEKYRHQKYPLPSVFQVRLLGCKGVLSVKPTLENGMEIRKSMEKFTWSLPGSFPLGVVDKGYSRPYEVASLNKQFILLLSALGISDEVFLEKQKAYFQDVISLTHNKETAFTYLCAFGEISIAERLLETDDFDKVVLAKIKSIQQRVYGSSKHKTGVKNKKSPAERLKIPVEKSRNVYGISDPSEGDLEYGTCFFQPTIRGNATVIDGKVVVAKNPCYSPGDIRILTCVDVPCCHHLVDCIVFPTEGKRPHPDEIAGSDLDGDKFFVCWDSELIPCKSENPVSYPSAKVRPMNCIKQKDMIEYFARYSNATIGKVDSLFSKWADREGVGSVECQMLSALFSRVIDSAKTGERVIIPKHLQISSEAPHEEKFVWHKMALRANLFLEDRASNAERSYPVQLTEDTVRSILSNEIISVSEYQLFRFLYKWAKQEKVKAKQLCAIAEKHIDFTQFSPQQLELAPIDILGINQDVLRNPFTRSEILSEYDRKNLVSDLGDIPRRYSMVFKSDAEDLSWNVLNNVLTSALAKILIFKFLLGNMKWVFVLNLPQKLASREALEVNEAEDSLIPRAYISIHQDKPVSKRFLLKGGYSISLDDQRLQIYQGGTKTKTFISFMVNDANDLSIVSIDLERIDRSLAKKYGIRLRKEAFVSLEVYCHDATGAPIPKIHRVDQQTAEEPLSSSQEASVSDYRITDEDFPDLGEEHGGIHLETEEELSKLRDLQRSGNLETKNFHQIRDLLVLMKDCPMERHEWSCKLESFLDECAISFGNQDDYVRLLLYLLDGLKKCNLSTLIGNRVNITLLGRIRRVLENMERNNILCSVENIFELLETLLFVHDWHTSVFVVKLFKLGHFPIAGTQFLPHANTVGYFVHWVSLLYLEILEEIREQEGQDMSHKGNPLVFQGNVFRETSEGDKSKASECTIFVQQGEATCSPGDFLALSPTNARHVFCERKYIVEVKSIAGNHMSVEVVWPKQECVIDDVIRQHTWKIVPFPNLVSCNRMLDSLRKLCTATSLEDVGVFSKLLSTWGVVQEKGDGSERLTDELSQELSYLNPSQRLAVQQACCNKPGLTLIQGPPGTGKSKTSASIIQKLLAQDPNGKILAVAETNEGVDNLLEKIVDVAKSIPELELLRLGSSTWTVRENLRKYTLASRYKERSGGKLVKEDRMDSKFVKKILKEARVVCTTCISAGSKILEKMQFSRLLVDEASQATEPAILVPISKGCKVLVLVGDDKQLPPTVKCNAAKQLSETSFSRMRSAGEPVYLLDTQYRMHPAIAEFPSKVFYNGELKDGVKEQERPTPQGFCWPKARIPVAFVEMTDNAKEEGGRSKKNTKEAAVVKQIITNLLTSSDLQPAEIGVVTPYKAQVKLLSDEIRDHPEVSVRTVDGFQGQEREVIVFSAVRCNDVGHLGFLDDDKRMNVLLTRAKRGLIVIGNKKTLVESDKDSTWNKWVKWIEEEELTVDSAKFLPDSHTCDSGQSREQSQGRGRGQRKEATRGTRGSGRRGGKRGRGK